MNVCSDTSVSTSVTMCIGGSRGGREGRTPPPGRPNSFDFMQFSGKFGVFTPPLEGSRPPPRENPGSATDVFISVLNVPDGNNWKICEIHFN